MGFKPYGDVVVLRMIGADIWAATGNGQVNNGKIHLRNLKQSDEEFAIGGLLGAEFDMAIVVEPLENSEISCTLTVQEGHGVRRLGIQEFSGTPECLQHRADTAIAVARPVSYFMLYGMKEEGLIGPHRTQIEQLIRKTERAPEPMVILKARRQQDKVLLNLLGIYCRDNEVREYTPVSMLLWQ